MYHKKDALWAKVILKKYCSQSRRKPKDPKKLSCSANWKAIKMGFTIFSKGICWNVGDGMTINFWTNRWLRGCAPRELIEGPINKMKCKLTVADVLQGSEWNWAALSFNRIKAIPIQLFGRKEDTLSWRQSKDGEFSTASAYMLANTNENQDDPFTGEWIWKLDTLPRIQSFLWLLHHSSVPVKEMLANRGIECNIACPLCRNANKIVLHLLRECPYVVQLLRKVGIPAPVETSYNLELLQWLKVYCLSNPDVLSNGVP